MSMNADRREERHMNGMAITVSQATTVPQYGKTAAGLLEAARTFFREPENEKEYRKWKEGKSDVDGDRVRAG